MIDRFWIPRVPLAAGACFSMVSWILVALYGWSASFGVALAWIHTLALGAFTTIALSILLHALTGFTDLEWRGSAVARGALLVLIPALVGLFFGFGFFAMLPLALSGTLAALLILTYCACAVATLLAPPPGRAEAAIARAFLIVIAFLAVTVVLGAVIAWLLVSGNALAFRLAPAHGVAGIAGWLTMLTMGVSARTLRPILGATTRFTWMHIASNTLVLAFAAIAVFGAYLQSEPLLVAASVAGIVGALLYGIDVGDRLRRAQTPQRGVHAFVAAAILWMFVAAVCFALQRYDIAAAAALAGWLYNMVYAHLHHIGIRVILTTRRGEDDETRPWAAISGADTWLCFILTQAAAAALLAGYGEHLSTVLFASSAAGIAANAVFIGNAVRAAGSR